MRINSRRVPLLIALCIMAALGILCGLNLFEPAQPSPEWIYTLKILNRVALPALVGLLAMSLLLAVLAGKNRLSSGKACLLFFLAACLFVAIPLASSSVYHISWQRQYFLSFCWTLGFLCAGFFAFGIAGRLSALWATLCCLVGSICFAFSALEGYFLLTAQPADGLGNASAQSQYVKAGAIPEPTAWEGFVCGSRYATHDRPAMVAHRMDKFGKPVFDVRYGLSPSGRRILPDMQQEAIYGLLLFGCSYTFGHSLADEQTWPWQLAGLLGPQWKIENYAMTGWSINQTLCLLEHDLVAKPEASDNFAIFLAIRDHVRRNDFYPGTPVYHIDEKGEAVAGGKPKYNTLHRVPEIFNGSQLAREASGWIGRLVMKQPQRMNDLYLALLKKTAKLLRDKYDTALIALIWPDIEELGPSIAALGIPVLYAKAMMPDYDKNPGAYYVSPFDGHPNEKAARALARGVADYLRRLVSDDGNGI